MNKDGQPTGDWVADAVRARLAMKAEETASAELRERCRAAALGALDVLKMQQQRPYLAASSGSMLEHFEALARRAGVSLDNAFRALGITRADAPDAASAHGLALLARQLGLARDEALLRLRWGFAQLVGGLSAIDWGPVPLLARGRHLTGTAAKRTGLDEKLRRCEAEYSPTRRAELRAAINGFAEAYDQEML